MATINNPFYGTPLWIENVDQFDPAPWITLAGNTDPRTTISPTGTAKLSGVAPSVQQTLSIAPSTGALASGTENTSITLAQAAVVGNNAGSSTLQLTLNNVTNGNLLVLVASWENTTGSTVPPLPTDSTGQTWVVGTRVTGQAAGSNWIGTAVFYLPSAINGTHTVTFNNAGSTGQRNWCSLMEWAGTLPNSPKDGSGFNVGTTAQSLSVVTGALVSATELAVVALAFESSPGVASASPSNFAGYTQLQVNGNTSSDMGVQQAYRVATGSVGGTRGGTWTWTDSGTQASAGQVYTFQAANGSAPVVVQNNINTENAGALALTGVAPMLVQGNVDVENAGALALTGVAPVLSAGIVSAAGALTLSSNAQSVSYGTVMPTAAGSLVLTGVAPTPTIAAGGITITTAVGALTLTGVAPTPTIAAGGITITTAVGALTLTGVAPVLSTGIVPNAGALTLTGVASTTATQVTPSVGTLVLSGVTSTLNLGIAPNAGALTLTGVASTTATTVTPSVGALVLSGVAPVLSTGVVPSAGSVALSGVAPVLSTGVTPSVGALALSGTTPILGTGIAPSVGSLLLSGVAAKFNLGIAPNAGALALTGVASTTATTVTPSTGTLVLSGVASTLNLGIAPNVGSLTLTGVAPALGIAAASPGTGTISLSGVAPVFNIGAVTGAGALVLTGAAVVPSVQTVPSTGALASGTENTSITLAQAAVVGNNAGSSTLQLTLNNVTNGNLLVLVASWENTTGSTVPPLPTDSTGQTWVVGTRVTGQAAGSNWIGTAVFYLPSAINGTHTVTFNNAGSAGQINWCALTEWAGTLPNSPADGSGFNAKTTQQSLAVTTGALVSATELSLAVLGFDSNPGVANAAPSNFPGYTQLQASGNTSSDMGVQQAYRVVTGSVGGTRGGTWTWTDSGTQASAGLIYTFQPENGSAPTVSTSAVFSTATGALIFSGSPSTLGIAEAPINGAIALSGGAAVLSLGTVSVPVPAVLTLSGGSALPVVPVLLAPATGAMTTTSDPPVVVMTVTMTTPGTGVVGLSPAAPLVSVATVCGSGSLSFSGAPPPVYNVVPVRPSVTKLFFKQNLVPAPIKLKVY